MNKTKNVNIRERYLQVVTCRVSIVDKELEELPLLEPVVQHQLTVPHRVQCVLGNISVR